MILHIKNGKMIRLEYFMLLFIEIITRTVVKKLDQMKQEVCVFWFCRNSEGTLRAVTK